MTEAKPLTGTRTQRWVMQHISTLDHRLTLGPGSDTDNTYYCFTCNSWLRIDVARSAEEFNKVVRGER